VALPAAIGEIVIPEVSAGAFGASAGKVPSGFVVRVIDQLQSGQLSIREFFGHKTLLLIGGY
jgi:hypothetical protein